MQVLAVVDAADGGLGVASGQDLQHVWRDVVLGLGLLVRLFVQTLQARETKPKNHHLPDTGFMCEWLKSCIHDGTHIQDQLAGFDAASGGGIVLERFGQAVEGLELLIVLLVLHLMGGEHPIFAFAFI